MKKEEKLRKAKKYKKLLKELDVLVDLKEVKKQLDILIKDKKKLKKSFKLIKLASMKNNIIDYAIFLFMFIFMILSLAGIRYIIKIIGE